MMVRLLLVGWGLGACFALLFGCSAQAQPATLQPVVAPPPGVPAGIPREAFKYRNQIIREARYYWRGEIRPEVAFGQIHQESSFKAEARSRFASGLAQFTPATAAGWARAADLKALCADSGGCPLDPAWAIRALVLYDRDLYKINAYAEGDERLAFMLASYNGGQGWLNRERAWCQRSGWCPPNVYFGQVQLACGKSTPARADWACKENNHYPEVILNKWRPLYARWLAGA